MLCAGNFRVGDDHICSQIAAEQALTKGTKKAPKRG
jgi:hypothetical protein